MADTPKKAQPLTLPRLLMLLVIGAGTWVYNKYLGGSGLPGMDGSGSRTEAPADPGGSANSGDKRASLPPKSGDTSSQDRPADKSGSRASEFGRNANDSSPPPKTNEKASNAEELRALCEETTRIVATEFRARRSDKIFVGAGKVDRLLPDDLDGSKHQRFILRLTDGKTLLVSHNIDLAPRVPAEKGDILKFKGEYEWSDPGGVVHWTHHNPNRNPRHPHGWLELDGKRYE